MIESLDEISLHELSLHQLRCDPTITIDIRNIKSNTIVFHHDMEEYSPGDMAIIDELILYAGTARPFYFTPPDDRYADAILCKLARDPQIRQQRSNPGVSGPAYEVQLDLIEVAG